MNTSLKTLVLAAAGAALLAAAPASAQTQRQTVERNYAPPVSNYAPVAPAVQNGPFGWLQNGAATFNSADTYGQIRIDQLKDSPTYNGNAY